MFIDAYIGLSQDVINPRDKEVVTGAYPKILPIGPLYNKWQEHMKQTRLGI